MNDEKTVYEISVNGVIQGYEDPILTGRQILDGFGYRPADAYLLFQFGFESGIYERKLVESIRIDGDGVEKFRVFESDRSYRLSIDDERYEWGDRFITGRDILEVVGRADCVVKLERKDIADRTAGLDEIIDLDGEELEHFYLEPVASVLCIEGKSVEWEFSEITTEQIIELGGWPPSQGVIEVDECDQTERTLSPGEVVRIKPGKSYGKKICWKRGLDRIADELELLKRYYPDIEYQFANGLHWFYLPNLVFDMERPSIPVVFYVTEGHPGAEPYGFFFPQSETSTLPVKNTRAKVCPPFEGAWTFVSWSPVTWRPKGDLISGDNLWGWSRGFKAALNGAE